MDIDTMYGSFFADILWASNHCNQKINLYLKNGEKHYFLSGSNNAYPLCRILVVSEKE